ncbi:hypothetical protein jhhlp_008059 [Lomentospora prolificans]|uniref:Uncharacterized protein n=1 Tax=Lomentospora prolificans TaxID=41688 RepID=A0A2N3MZF2_9PEZI|nr:hypothetical protein jhhlp_008059 [Lomentospora prolificans]
MTSFTDEELDRDWKPNGRRPQSTIARSFSAELMDIFKIDNSVADLDQQVDKHKQTVNQQTSELEALEKRIREMEERLRRSKARLSRQGIPNYDPNLVDAAGAEAESEHAQNAQQPRQVEEQFQKSKSRPGSSMTARPAPSAGDMPPTPVASEGEYEVVNRADLEDDDVAHPHAPRR